MALIPSPISLTTGQTHEMIVGGRRFHLHRESEERWHLLIFDTSASDGDPIDDRLFLVSRKHDRIFVSFSGQPLPLLVAFQNTFSIPPGESITLRFLVPVNLQLAFDEEKKREIYDHPCRTLSKTWVGTFTEGELGLFWRTPLILDDSLEWEGLDLALCAMQINNRSEVGLPLSRVGIRLAHSSLYESGGRLFTGQIWVNYRGNDTASEIRYRDQPPRFLKEEAKLAYPARSPQTKKLVSWTVQNLANPAFFWR